MDRIRNEYFRGSGKVGPIEEKIQESRMRWFGHLERRDDAYIGKRLENLEITGKEVDCR